jgi:hypothetical protein
MQAEIYEDNSTFEEYKAELEKYKDKSIHDVLTHDELEELKNYPIGDTSVLEGYTHFTDSKVVDIRRNIAKKITKIVFANDTTLTDKYLQIYHKYPMWKFYTTKNDENIIPHLN